MTASPAPAVATPAPRPRGDVAPRRLRTLLVTDRSQVPNGRHLLDVVTAALGAGADGVLVRERDLPPTERARLVARVAALCADHAAVLVVASPLPAFEMSSAPGAGPPHLERVLHLRRDEPAPPESERPRTGRSCHDVAELARAADEGLGHVTLSPVAHTASKPGHGPALGLTGLRDVIAAASKGGRVLPAVLALGGVEPANAGSWVEAGATGVAVMGAVMRSPDPAATTRAVVEAVRAAAGPNEVVP